MFVLGVDLCVRRFTPSAGKLLNLVPGDVGRPIGNIKLAVDLPDLEAMVAEVIESVQPKEREVRDRAGRWHMLRSTRIGPRRTGSTGPWSCCWTSTRSRGSEQRLRESIDYAQAIAETVREPLVVLDPAPRPVGEPLLLPDLRPRPGRDGRPAPPRPPEPAVGHPRASRLFEEVLPGNRRRGLRGHHQFEEIGPKVMVVNPAASSPRVTGRSGSCWSSRMRPSASVPRRS